MGDVSRHVNVNSHIVPHLVKLFSIGRIASRKIVRFAHRLEALRSMIQVKDLHNKQKVTNTGQNGLHNQLHNSIIGSGENKIH